jgi:hypothetical protein
MSCRWVTKNVKFIRSFKNEFSFFTSCAEHANFSTYSATDLQCLIDRDVRTLVNVLQEFNIRYS